MTPADVSRDVREHFKKLGIKLKCPVCASTDFKIELITRLISRHAKTRVVDVVPMTCAACSCVLFVDDAAL